MATTAMQTMCFQAPFSGDLPIFAPTHVQTGTVSPPPLAEHLATAMQFCVDGGGSRPDTAVSCWPKRGDAALGFLETKHISATGPGMIWTHSKDDSFGLLNQNQPDDRLAPQREDYEAGEILCSMAASGRYSSSNNDGSDMTMTMTMIDIYGHNRRESLQEYISYLPEDIAIPVANPEDWPQHLHSFKPSYYSPPPRPNPDLQGKTYPQQSPPFPDISDFYFPHPSFPLQHPSYDHLPSTPFLEDFPSTSTTSTNTPLSTAALLNNNSNFDHSAFALDTIIPDFDFNYANLAPGADQYITNQASLDEFLQSLEADGLVSFDGTGWYSSWDAAATGAAGDMVGISQQETGQPGVIGVKIPPGVVERLEAVAEVWSSPPVQRVVGMMNGE